MEEKLKIYQALLNTLEKVHYAMGNKYLDSKGITVDAKQESYVIKDIYEKDTYFLEMVYKNSKMKLIPKWELINYKQFIYEYALYINGLLSYTFTRDEGNALHEAYNTNYATRIKKQEDLKRAQIEKNFKEWLKNNT